MNRWFGLFGLLLLTGCAGPALVPVADPEKTWELRVRQLALLERWQLSGRLGITEGEEVWHLKIRWRQAPDRFQIDLAGPFGAGHVKLVGQAEGVELRDSKGGLWWATDAETLLWQHTGIHMPISDMRYWIRGLPSPRQDTRRMRLDVAGRLAALQQDGWSVQFQEYLRVDGQTLPRSLLIRRHDIEVKLVVDRWQLAARVPVAKP